MPNRIQFKITPTGLFVVAGIWVAFASSRCHAQSPTQGMRSGNSNRSSAAPYQQRLSPYLDLLRTDNSALSPYHSFVQPRQQFRQIQSRQAAQIRNLDRMIPRTSGGAASSERIQTGRGGMFNNYLHYYQLSPTAVR